MIDSAGTLVSTFCTTDCIRKAVASDRAWLPRPDRMHCIPQQLRREALELITSAIYAADPAIAVRTYLSWATPTTLTVGGTCVDLAGSSLFVIALGKAAVPMASEALHILRSNAACPRIRGVVVTKRGTVGSHDNLGLTGLDLLEAAHPQPDETSVAAGRRILDLAGCLCVGETVLVLLSGGASALTLVPRDKLSVADLQAVNAALLGCGAPIGDVNALRKHLSLVGGGQLGARCAAAGARCVATLALSDVTGDQLDSIGSGPTVPDSTSWARCLDIVGRYAGLRAALPAPALAMLEAGAAGLLPENPSVARPCDIACIIGSNALSAAAAARAAGVLGYHVVRLGSSLEGEAREVAKVVVALLLGARAGPSQSDLASPSGRASGVCLVLGGETTVTLSGGPTGLGGRNQELALAAALHLAATVPERASESDPELGPHCAVLSFGTDGGDGPTDAAGAVVTEWTVRSAAAAGLDAGAALSRHDSHSFFRALGEAGEAEKSSVYRPGHGATRTGTVGAGGLVRTGPTGTNVCDLVIALFSSSGWAEDHDTCG